MDFSVLFNALPGAVAQGLIWGIMAIGVYITYKILDVADLTVDGTMCTGGVVCVVMMLSGQNVWVSILCAVLAGLIAGLATGAGIGLAVLFKVNHNQKENIGIVTTLYIIGVISASVLQFLVR